MTESKPQDVARHAAIDWPAALAQHDRWLRTLAFARLGERQAIDDVMQEVSYAAVAQKAPLSDPSKVASWLYQLVVRQSLLYRRKTGRRRKMMNRFVDRVHPTEEDHRTVDPLSWLIADERRQMIRRALAELPKRDAEILLLKYTEDWSYRQMAKHLGISSSAVESRLHRARQKMRQALAALEIVEVS